MEFGYTMM